MMYEGYDLDLFEGWQSGQEESMALHQEFEWRNQFCGASRLRLAQSVDGWSGQSEDLD